MVANVHKGEVILPARYDSHARVLLGLLKLRAKQGKAFSVEKKVARAK